MNFEGKISNVVQWLYWIGSLVSLSVFAALLATGGAAWQSISAAFVTLIFIGLIWLTSKKQSSGEDHSDTATKATAPQETPAPKENVYRPAEKSNDISKLSRHLRIPLENIASAANVLSGDCGTDNKQTLIDSLMASVETIADLSEMIIGETDGSQADSGPKACKRLFDLRSLITQTADLIPGVEVKLEVYGALPRLKGNPVKMRQIMLCIFDFFLKYTPKDSLPARVTIVVNRVRIPIKPIKYRFDVKSDCGIALDADAEIAELNTAKRLIEELGGNIKQRFEDDSTFIYYNVCFDDEETTAAGGEITSAASSPVEVYTKETAGFADVAKAKDLGDANIIVCDDNPINQKVMSLSLDKHVKTITLASNGQECVDLVSGGRYDLILMDIQMPVLDGYEATKQIRSMEQSTNAHIPIVAVTANTMSGDRQQCLNIGMDDYISKPFQIEDVLCKMKELLAKPKHN